MADYLKALPVHQVAKWYRRLAERIARERIKDKDEEREPLAATFLKHWLDNRNSKSTFHFDAPGYLRDSSYVQSALHYQRNVFLSREPARVGDGETWAGVVPRLQGDKRFEEWEPGTLLDMHYESLVEVGSNLLEIYRIQRSGTPAERDLLTSLRGFQLKSRVTVSGERLEDSNVCVTFVSWMSSVIDFYDFDYSEHFTVPNPDYLSKESYAVRPKDKSLKVYHSNARRLEQAGLAAPYHIESNEWRVANWSTERANVNPAQDL